MQNFTIGVQRWDTDFNTLACLKRMDLHFVAYVIGVSFVLKSTLTSESSCCYEDTFSSDILFKSPKMSGINYNQKLSDEFKSGIKCLERAAEGWIYELAENQCGKGKYFYYRTASLNFNYTIYFSGHTMRCRIGLFAVGYLCCTCIYCKIPLSKEAISKKFTLGSI